VIKTIFFDFGGVIVKLPNLWWIRRLKNKLALEEHPEILEMIENPYDAQLVTDICLGNISEDYLWEFLSEKLKVNPIMLKKIRLKFFSKRQLNRQVVKYLARLSLNYDTAILSNAGDKSRQLMEETYGLNRYVKEIIISAEEGVIKPDHRIFEIALNRMKAEPGTSLLLDDYYENVLSARKFGIHAVHFLNTKQALNDVRFALNGRK